MINKMSKKIKHLVVDTTAFIRAANLQDIAESAYTVQEVVDEITNDRQRRKLVVLPYDLKIKDVFTENIKFVSEFAKKTGDYTSLSATDIKVMALTYQLEKEVIGADHLKTEPTIQKTIKVTGLPGYNSNVDENTITQSQSSPQVSNLELHSSDNAAVDKGQEKLPNPQENEVDVTESNQVNNDLRNVEITVKDGEQSDDDDNKMAEEIAKQIKNMDLRDDEDVDNYIAKVSDNDEESESEESDSDDGEWITPSNLKEKKKELDDGVFEEKNVEVACITSDFAMQNVLKQIGLNVTSIDGRVIRQLRTFIFRCTTCFKTTSIMTKLFCPKCGHATLKKVSVSVDEHGNQHIHINGKKPLTARGKRFSLPTPRGGQHFQYPIVTEDQHIHKRFATRMARSKTNALDPDYTAGFSPFVMKDVNSKSAVLGVRANKQDIKYWMKHYSKGKKK
ncbi:RNA-binding protein NOB1 [Bicyclus anynana]|uniref:RNA-binding protein NOB1 n=1 Tax=Bicyclus anynana TaxID=110368 RepID=A0A6J1NAZ7_BICAN|nr:RNA-binding protein NOB1 [Bicyclus anynana]